MSLLNITSEEEMTSVLDTRRWKLLPKEKDSEEDWIFITDQEPSVKSTNIKEKVTFDAMTSMANAFKPSAGEFFIQHA